MSGILFSGTELEKKLEGAELNHCSIEACPFPRAQSILMFCQHSKMTKCIEINITNIIT
jgi:hypothetical protein